MTQSTEKQLKEALELLTDLRLYVGKLEGMYLGHAAVRSYLPGLPREAESLCKRLDKMIGKTSTRSLT